MPFDFSINYSKSVKQTIDEVANLSNVNLALRYTVISSG